MIYEVIQGKAKLRAQEPRGRVVRCKGVQERPKDRPEVKILAKKKPGGLIPTWPSPSVTLQTRVEDGNEPTKAKLCSGVATGYVFLTSGSQPPKALPDPS